MIQENDSISKSASRADSATTALPTSARTERETTMRTIEQHVDLAASPEAVFRALTDAAEITRWFAPDAKVTPGQGGKIWIAWPGGMEGESDIEVWDPPRRVKLRNKVPGETQPSLVAVDYRIEARKDGGSTLRLVHSGFGAGAEFDREYDETTRGWLTFFGNLRHYLARHGGVPCRQLQLPTMIQASIADAYETLLSRLGVSASGLQAGDRFEGALGGERIFGRVDAALPPYSFGLVVEPWNDAMLRVNFEHCGGPLMAWAVVLGYGVADERLDSIEAALKSVLATLG